MGISESIDWDLFLPIAAIILTNGPQRIYNSIEPVICGKDFESFRERMENLKAQNLIVFIDDHNPSNPVGYNFRLELKEYGKDMLKRFYPLIKVD